MDADGKLHPDRSYSLPELLTLELDRLQSFPDRSPNDARREIVDALKAIRYSYPFMLSQPKSEEDEKAYENENILIQNTMSIIGEEQVVRAHSNQSRPS